VASGQTAIRVARFAEKEAVVAIPETLLGRAKDGVGNRDPMVGAEQEIRGKIARDCARGRSRDPHLSGKVSLPDAGENVFARMTATLTLPIPQPNASRGAIVRRCIAERSPSSTSSMLGRVPLKPVAVKSYESMTSSFGRRR